ncbi:hypothetical protein EUX98_g7920 [Antrodiella citrinella]|uniref:FHA domain-containing protein n=1 Tax=Antrodiella citrinella TaxID=2447956 RepID=A0A4S4MCN4_9APHY|nr:hypothetical protein EUX98_g7920 [Antrodiella citrinella]
MPPFASSPISQVPYPALYLYPLNDSFIPKHISLVNGQRVKIGRQTNAKTVPAERNGYFDSKVLSRQHAEVWEETGKIFIKDVKSSNGTFINSERLSAEGLESEPFELKNEDIVEFGIDIVGEDNKTIVHHKVAARVLCILNEQDAQNASRLEAQHQQNPPMYSLPGQGQGVGRNGNAFNFAGANQNGMNGVQGLQRGQVSRGVDLGGMGGNARQPMKGGITFQDLLSRLQGELQKSRETGSELTNLQNTMGDIHDTLGGNLPMNNPPYAHQLPPVVPPQAHGEGYHMTVPSSTSQEPVSALSELQSQLRQTQESLANHVDKIRSLEGMLAEHESIKREVSSMRDMMEERKREMELLRIHSQSPNRLRRSHSHVEDHDEGEYIPDDDDDARSVGTVVPHELERVDEEDEEQIAAEEEEEERRRRRDELGRPRTPEPTGMGMGINEDDEEHEDLHRDNTHLHPSSLPPATTNSASSAVPDELILRMTTLASQLESALELSRSLEAQHATAQSTISSLETKVAELESLVKSTQTQVQVQTESQQALAEAIDTKLHEHLIPPRFDDERERETLKEMFIEWKKGVEGQWSTVQEEWSEERDRMRRAKEEVDVRLRTIEDGVGSSVSKVETGMATLVALQAQLQHPQANGSAKPRSSGGLAQEAAFQLW